MADRPNDIGKLPSITCHDKCQAFTSPQAGGHCVFSVSNLGSLVHKSIAGQAGNVSRKDPPCVETKVPSTSLGLGGVTMSREEIIATARRVVSEGKPFVFATVDAEGGPRMRWMGGLLLEEPLTIYMACGASSRKMDQIRGNPKGQLMFQTEGFREVVTLYGTCQIIDDPQIKQKVWEAMPALANFMAGPDDPNLGVIRFRTERVEVVAAERHGEPPLVAEL